MKHMSANIERIAGTRLSELGTPVVEDIKYNHKKLKLRQKTKYHINQNEHDCISCTKHLTKKIPNNSQCKAICGTPAITVLKRRVAIVCNPNELTRTEIREILTMSRLIQDIERFYSRP
jgi:hypothetical protein